MLREKRCLLFKADLGGDDRNLEMGAVTDQNEKLRGEERKGGGEENICTLSSSH